ncbi:MAG: hypothetical protein MHMPM18_005204 [Marteilia pararefringens]
MHLKILSFFVSLLSRGTLHMHCVLKLVSIELIHWRQQRDSKPACFHLAIRAASMSRSEMQYSYSSFEIIFWVYCL